MAKLRGCGCSKEAFRIILWMSWVTNMLITTIYYILSGVTFYKLLTASGEAQIDTKSLVMNRVWRAPLAATFLAALLVFGFNMFSCFVLLKKSVNRSGPGFGYGFMVAFCFTLAFFCLLVGLIMDSFRDVVTTSLINFSSWTKYSTELYVGTEVFAFVCFAMFILFFLTLVIFQSAVTEHLGINTDMQNPYVPMADPALLGVAGAGAAMGPGAASSSDGKGLSSSDPQYGAQYNSNDYMTSDQYNQYYSTQYNQGGDAYQTTTEFNANEYAYDQEQGYQAPYAAAGGYAAVGGVAGSAALSQGAATPPYPAAPPAYNDPSAAAAASFYGQQGAYAQGAQYTTPGPQQQL